MDSNHSPLRYQHSALPNELTAQLNLFYQTMEFSANKKATQKELLFLKYVFYLLTFRAEQETSAPTWSNGIILGSEELVPRTLFEGLQISLNTP